MEKIVEITFEELGVHQGPTIRFTKRWLPHLRLTRDGQAFDLHVLRSYGRKYWHLVVHLSGRDWSGYRYVRRVRLF